MEPKQAQIFTRRKIKKIKKKFNRFEKKVFKLCKINGEWDEST